MVKKRTLVLAFLASPQGQKVLKDVYRKLDTPKNREKLSEFTTQFKERAVELKEKSKPKVEELSAKLEDKVKEKSEKSSEKATVKADGALTDVKDARDVAAEKKVDPALKP